MVVEDTINQLVVKELIVRPIDSQTATKLSLDASILEEISKRWIVFRSFTRYGGPSRHAWIYTAISLPIGQRWSQAIVERLLHGRSGCGSLGLCGGGSG